MANKFTLQPLPFPYDALEPYIDEETLHLHHDKHHQAYVDKLNTALQPYPKFYQKTIPELLCNLDELPNDVKQEVINQGGGVYNHDFYWHNLSPSSPKEPTGDLKKAINETFGSFEAFKQQFTTSATSNFGSGWTWLVKNKDGSIKIMNTSNQDSPISQGLTPLITADVWEHAYYLKYKNKRPEYLNAFWNIVNWQYADDLFTGKISPFEC